ncbi:hypothetical protein FOS14_07340 [Skermania sp. ID1734]|uniref:hypothetical protein n=1 Tax=Skermania sp. ID1734 TaxID=2597516 RepID=UPI001180400E|nr:hypothetical protein [Skermania sp. ID1734]TSE00810.1 hypothetical protein FOS14_07340 [Skermania sp. ID1734]
MSIDSAAESAKVAGQRATVDSVKVTLGDHEQPKQPITLTFDLSNDPDFYRQISDSVRPLIALDPVKGSPTDYLAPHWDSSAKTLTARTLRLSVFQPILIDIGKVLTDAAHKSVPHLASPPPPCAESSDLDTPTNKLTLTAKKPGPVGGCLKANGDNSIDVDFTSTSPQYYAVESKPAGKFTLQEPPNFSGALASFAYAVAQRPVGLLVPNGKGALQLPAGTTEGSINLDVDPAALQIETILTGVDMLLGEGVVSKVLENALSTPGGAYGCMKTAFASLTDPDKKNLDEFISALGDVGSCASTIAGTAVGDNESQVLHRMGAAISIFTTLPAQLAANIDGIIGEFDDANHLEFTLTGTPKETTPPSTTSAAPSAPDTNNLTLNLSTKRTDNAVGRHRRARPLPDACVR